MPKPVLCVELTDGTSVKIDCKKLHESPLSTLTDLQNHINALAPEYAGEIDARNLELYDNDFERYVRLHDVEDLLEREKGAVLRTCPCRTPSNENVPLGSDGAGAPAPAPITGNVSASSSSSTSTHSTPNREESKRQSQLCERKPVSESTAAVQSLDSFLEAQQLSPFSPRLQRAGIMSVAKLRCTSFPELTGRCGFSENESRAILAATVSTGATQTRALRAQQQQQQQQQQNIRNSTQEASLDETHWRLAQSVLLCAVCFAWLQQLPPTHVTVSNTDRGSSHKIDFDRLLQLDAAGFVLVLVIVLCVHCR